MPHLKPLEVLQRYAQHMPTRGEMAIFDRSWYNRAGVEPVFGFCKPEETKAFLREAPAFEAAFVRDGARFFKFFLTIGKEMQIKRLHDRWADELNRWKISDIDARAIEKWDAYSDAVCDMVTHTSTTRAPRLRYFSSDASSTAAISGSQSS